MPKSIDSPPTSPSTSPSTSPPSYILLYKDKECIKKKINQLSYDNFKLLNDKTKIMNENDIINTSIIIANIIGTCIKKYNWENYPKDKIRTDLFHKMDETYGFDLANQSFLDCLFKNISSKYTFPEYYMLLINYQLAINTGGIKDYKVIVDFDNYMKSLNKICTV